MDQAVHRFDSAYRKVLSKPETRHTLGFTDQAVFDSADPVLVINAFNVPELTPHTKQIPPARLEIKNASAEPVTQAKLSVNAAAQPLFASAIPDLAPGATQSIPISLNGIEHVTSRFVRITAVITYQTGSTFGKVSSVASLILRKPNGRAELTESSAPARYYRLIDVAVEHYNNGEWTEARTYFEKSHALYPCARTYRALGMVEFDLGNYAAATNYLQEALASSVKPLDEQLRQEVTELLARISHL
jgi:tetratricopeptide (TPR) repeat protein